MDGQSLHLLTKYGRDFIKPGARVLEVGPEKVPSFSYEAVADESLTWEYVDIHPTFPGVHVAEGSYRYPFADESFDVVYSANVLEHVSQPWTLMCELARVVKRKGHIISVVPVSWPFHEWPIDAWRMYPEAFKA